jgi:hypothetical protein
MANPAEAVAIVATVGTMAGSVLYLVKTTLDHLRTSKTEKLQADLYARMLDRFGSSQDLLAYLQTDAGKNLLKTAAPVEAAPMPTRRIMNSVQIGTVLIAFGAAMLMLKAALEDSGSQEPLTVFGIIGVMTGVGFLVSAFASWKLSKAWGLMGPGKEQQ